MSKKIPTVNLTLHTVYVKSKVKKLRSGVHWKIGQPIYDCCDDECAQVMGFNSRKEYRIAMNSKEDYKFLIKMMGEV